MKKLAVVLVCVTLIGSCKKREEGFGDSKPDTAAHQTTTTSASTATGTDVGATMPEYSAMWLDGSKFELAKRRDKVVLLNLWATWCGPCRYEIPELQSLHAKYSPKGFEVIGVSVDESGVDAVKKFVDEQKMTYPVVLDAEGKLAGVFQTSVLPTSALVDRNGKIVWKRYGLILANDEELRKAIEKSL